MANLLWIQAVGCGGETVSLLNCDHPHLQAALHTLDVVILGHPYLHGQTRGTMEQTSDECASGKVPVDLLVVEGAIYQTSSESPTWVSGKPLTERIRAIAASAAYTVAVGTCASFGGIMACGRNPKECGSNLESKHKKLISRYLLEISTSLMLEEIL